MKIKFGLSLLILLLVLSACQPSAPAQPIPTLTPVPGATALPPATAAPVVPAATPADCPCADCSRAITHGGRNDEYASTFGHAISKSDRLTD